MSQYLPQMLLVNDKFACWHPTIHTITTEFSHHNVIIKDSEGFECKIRPKIKCLVVVNSNLFVVFILMIWWLLFMMCKNKNMYRLQKTPLSMRIGNLLLCLLLCFYVGVSRNKSSVEKGQCAVECVKVNC